MSDRSKMMGIDCPDTRTEVLGDDDALLLDRWREAAFDAHGFVKWDGCAQWSCDVHLDGRQPRRSFFDAVDRAHFVAAEIMDGHWDGDSPEEA